MEKKNYFQSTTFSKDGIFYGYASIFNIKDSYDDIILPFAFKNAIRNNKNLKLLWQHNNNFEIGSINLMKEDFMGLYIEGQIDLNNNNDIYDLVKNNIIDGLSIGYNVEKFHFDNRGNRILEEINLVEISIVSNPANKFANITYCKSKDLFFPQEEIIVKINNIIDNLNL